MCQLSFSFSCGDICKIYIFYNMQNDHIHVLMINRRKFHTLVPQMGMGDIDE